MKAAFTTADNYVVNLDGRLEGDFRLLVMAAALAVDTAPKQDARGIDITDVVDSSDCRDGCSLTAVGTVAQR